MRMSLEYSASAPHVYISIYPGCPAGAVGTTMVDTWRRTPDTVSVLFPTLQVHEQLCFGAEFAFDKLFGHLPGLGSKNERRHRLPRPRLPLSTPSSPGLVLISKLYLGQPKESGRSSCTR